MDHSKSTEHGAVHAPIHLSVPCGHPNTASLIEVFQQRRPGFTYARQSNPTNVALEAKISLYEGALESLTFATGMGVISALFFALLRQGDHLICSRHVFGNTSSLIGSFQRFGVSVDFVDATDAGNVQRMLTPSTRMVFVETIANPGTEIADLEGIGLLCREKGELFVVDNSLTTPALIQPGRFGAGLVVSSLTKGFGGRGQAMGGAISDTGQFDWRTYPGIDALYRNGDPLKFGLTQIRRKGLRDGGATLRPDDAHRLAVGAETLPLRLEKACANALELAQWLEAQPNIKSVRYPGLESHPQHERAATLFGDKFGQLLSFTFVDGVDPAEHLDRLRRVILATHLWDTRTLALPVAHTIYLELGPDGRREAGIDDGLVRVSVGIEPICDIVGDFEQAISIR